MEKKPLLILGVGNLVLQDEGLGIHAIRELEKYPLPITVDTLDGGTAGLNLMGRLQEYERVIIIDAAINRNPIGTVRHIIPQFLNEYPPLITVHEIGLKDVIEAMRLTGYCPIIELITVTVEKYDSLGITLSPKVAQSIPKIITLIGNIINIPHQNMKLY